MFSSHLLWRYILPFSSPVAVKDIRLQKHINRVMSIVNRNIIGLSVEERADIRRHARTFDFSHHRTFMYETDSVFLTLFLQNTRKDEYIIIYTA